MVIITPDGNHKFAPHGYITRKLSINIYFARPYLGEAIRIPINLFRRYSPKHRQLDTPITDKVQCVEDCLNNRPRKVLGFKTPLEIR